MSTKQKLGKVFPFILLLICASLVGVTYAVSTKSPRWASGSDPTFESGTIDIDRIDGDIELEGYVKVGEGTPSATLGDGDLYVLDDLEIDGSLVVAGDFAIEGYVWSTAKYLRAGDGGTVTIGSGTLGDGHIYAENGIESNGVLQVDGDATFTEDVSLAVGADDKVTFTAGYFTQFRIGTGSSPGITLGADDAFIEGTLEVDGEFQADGIVDFNSTGEISGLFGANGGISMDGLGDDVTIATYHKQSKWYTFELDCTTLSCAIGDVALTNTNGDALVFQDNDVVMDAYIECSVEMDSAGDGASIELEVQDVDITAAIVEATWAAGYVAGDTEGLPVKISGASSGMDATITGEEVTSGLCVVYVEVMEGL